MPFTKIKDLRDLDLASIESEIIKLKKEFFFLKVKQATKQPVKPHIFKNTKHKLAQLLTLERQKKTNSLNQHAY
nr:ribosomal protein L29 [Gloiopeltis furcata]